MDKKDRSIRLRSFVRCLDRIRCVTVVDRELHEGIYNSNGLRVNEPVAAKKTQLSNTNYSRFFAYGRDADNIV
jgi:hypothetical protein